MIRAPGTRTKPAAGVIATSPATAPVAAPNNVAFLNTIVSNKIQVNVATEAAIVVLKNATPAIAFAPNAEPALNPYQPNHNIPAPTAVNTTLIGFIAIFGYPARLPSNTANTRPAKPPFI